MKLNKILLSGCFVVSLFVSTMACAYDDLTIKLDATNNTKQQGGIQLDVDNAYANDQHNHVVQLTINSSTQSSITVSRPDAINGLSFQYTILGVRIQGAQIPIICSPYSDASKFDPKKDQVTIHVSVTAEGIPSCVIDGY